MFKNLFRSELSITTEQVDTHFAQIDKIYEKYLERCEKTQSLLNTFKAHLPLAYISIKYSRNATYHIKSLKEHITILTELKKVIQESSLDDSMKNMESERIDSLLLNIRETQKELHGALQI